jgi:hypothetical protein
MGLFSVSKLLVLILVIGAVWYGFKIFARRNQGIDSRKKSGHVDHGRQDASVNNVQDMQSCTVCGTFVPNDVAKSCGRDACPYPN